MSRYKLNSMKQCFSLRSVKHWIQDKLNKCKSMNLSKCYRSGCIYFNLTINFSISSSIDSSIDFTINYDNYNNFCSTNSRPVKWYNRTSNSWRNCCLFGRSRCKLNYHDNPVFDPADLHFAWLLSNAADDADVKLRLSSAVH